MDYYDILEAIKIASNYSEIIAIGGGEPTLHPRFFDILKQCLATFDYVWMATNGSQTKTMYRLFNILNEKDYPEDEEDEYYDSIFPNGKLTVTLSQDYYHSQINQRIIDLWKRNEKNNGFEIRNVSGRVIGVGRALRTGEYQVANQCVCPFVIIRADGTIHGCGCKSSIKIGSIWSGMDSELWDKLTDDEVFQDTNCASRFHRSTVGLQNQIT